MKHFKITSYDTFSTLDGPGIRTVVFLSGCLNRCIYCHNPECFVASESRELEFDELAKIYNNNKPYYKDNGGLTFSGGEPLLQSEKIAQFIKEGSYNYVIETSGTYKGNELSVSDKEVLTKASLVYLDLKFISDEEYLKYTHNSLSKTLDTLEFLKATGVKFVVRMVVVPSINDTLSYLDNYVKYALSLGIKEIELLPYHSMGSEKYLKLGLPYELEGVKSLDKAHLDRLKDELRTSYSELITIL